MYILDTFIPSQHLPTQIDPWGADAQVIGILVALIFSCPGLNWKEGIQHFETFAGAKSVTCGELEAWGSNMGTKPYKAFA